MWVTTFIWNCNSDSHIWHQNGNYATLVLSNAPSSHLEASWVCLEALTEALRRHPVCSPMRELGNRSKAGSGKSSESWLIITGGRICSHQQEVPVESILAHSSKQPWEMGPRDLVSGQKLTAQAEPKDARAVKFPTRKVFFFLSSALLARPWFLCPGQVPLCVWLRRKYRGAPGWLSQLSVYLRLRSWSRGSGIRPCVGLPAPRLSLCPPTSCTLSNK